MRKEDKNIFINIKTGTSYIDISKPIKKAFKDNKIISLFSGAGGLDIGLESAGFQTSVCVEIDSDCRETLRFMRPNWKLFEDNKGRLAGDIRSIKINELLKLSGLNKGEAALVVGGAPCQPFSNMGKKIGKNDPKNGDLFLEFVRIVKGVMPKAFLFENVVGITQSKHSEIINYMKEKLKGLGYRISFTTLNAANYGVAQRRERFFLLGIKEINNPSFPFPSHTKNLKEWNNFVTSLNHTPDYIPQNWITLGDILKNIPADAVYRNDYAVMNISDVVKNRMKKIKPGKNFKTLPMNMRPNCWKNGKHQGQDTFGRLRLDEPSVTIRTAAYNPAKGKYIHPTENRGLNTIEMAVIQDFPYEWTFRCVGRKNITLVSAGRQIGNAVPPSLGKALGLAIKSQLLR